MNTMLQGRRGRSRSRRAPIAGAAATAALLAATTSPAHGAGLAQAADACGGAETPIGSTTLDAARDAIACLIAQVRSERDLGALRLDDRLTSAARSHAADMVRRGYFAHRSPGGSMVRDRLSRAGWIPSQGSWWAGEILVTGNGAASTPRRLVAAWLQSPPHRSVLLSARPDAIGLGAVRDTPDGGHEATGITVDAVLARRCAPGASGTDPLSGYQQENDPCAA